mmetsp:Transcript_31110/g.69116  ORF Transcript_31110/g.69116 Transcript_31110/m.69116 type:complete len:118 (+) Transcript_31110:746-1099(+)
MSNAHTPVTLVTLVTLALHTSHSALCPYKSASTPSPFFQSYASPCNRHELTSATGFHTSATPMSIRASAAALHVLLTCHNHMLLVSATGALWPLHFSYTTQASEHMLLPCHNSLLLV